MGQYPRPGKEYEYKEVLRNAEQFNADVSHEDGTILAKKLVDEIDTALLRNITRGAGGQLAPMNSIIGSIAAQEVMKGISGKFMPVRQFMVYDAVEALPEEDLPAEEYEWEGSRYDAQIACFGKSIQRKLEGLKYFLVGAGAIG